MTTKKRIYKPYILNIIYKRYIDSNPKYKVSYDDFKKAFYSYIYSSIDTLYQTGQVKLYRNFILRIREKKRRLTLDSTGKPVLRINFGLTRKRFAETGVYEPVYNNIGEISYSIRWYKKMTKGFIKKGYAFRLAVKHRKRMIEETNTELKRLRYKDL